MPVSKKRTAKKRVVRVPVVEAEPKRWIVKLNGSRLAGLRKDPDFQTIVKVGRVMNAVLFALDNITGNKKQSTVVEIRQYRRGTFVLAGYLHEGIKLVDSIKGRYLTYPEFEGLRAIALDAEYKKARRYVKKVRNLTAFHLDEFDESTRNTLQWLKPQMYHLMSGEDRKLGTFYFNFSDYLDLAYLAEELSDEKPRDQVINDIFMEIAGLAKVFLEACNTFQGALMDKIKLNDHVY